MIQNIFPVLQSERQDQDVAEEYLDAASPESQALGASQCPRNEVDSSPPLAPASTSTSGKTDKPAEKTEMDMPHEMEEDYKESDSRVLQKESFLDVIEPVLDRMSQLREEVPPERERIE